MKIRCVTYGDELGIETIDVTMTIGEAAALHALAGVLNGYGSRRLGLKDDESLYEALNELFCCHYDDGAPPDAPPMPILATLNVDPGAELL